ncbi:RNA chaperone Hfq [Bacillus bombysepticus]
MLLHFDMILQYVEQKEIACRFILIESKRVTGKVIGRDPYMIYVQDNEGQKHFLFKHAIKDVIPQQDVDLEKIKEEMSRYNEEKKRQKKLQKS